MASPEYPLPRIITQPDIVDQAELVVSNHLLQEMKHLHGCGCNSCKIDSQHLEQDMKNWNAESSPVEHGGNVFTDTK